MPKPQLCDRIDELTVTRIFTEARSLRLRIRTGVGYHNPATGECDPLGVLAIRAMPGLSGQSFGSERVIDATRLPAAFLRGMASGFDGMRPSEVGDKMEDAGFARGYELGKDCRIRAIVDEKRTVATTSKTKD
jgi:hypothetical protein